MALLEFTKWANPIQKSGGGGDGGEDLAESEILG